jgi:hypothetical protein
MKEFKKLWKQLLAKVKKLIFPYWKKIYNGWVGNLLIWITNVWVIYVTDRSNIRVFTGWAHFSLAKRYADKRSKLTKVNKVAGGKRHFVLPAGKESLIVVNRLEIL